MTEAQWVAVKSDLADGMSPEAVARRYAGVKLEDVRLAAHYIAIPPSSRNRAIILNARREMLEEASKIKCPRERELMLASIDANFGDLKR